MSNTRFLTSDQVSRIWTLYSADTIRELAREGKLPVEVWLDQEPIFARDSRTIRALIEVAHGNNGSAR